MSGSREERPVQANIMLPRYCKVSLGENAKRILYFVIKRLNEDRQLAYDI